jgi:hypothetical protein
MAQVPIGNSSRDPDRVNARLMRMKPPEINLLRKLTPGRFGTGGETPRDMAARETPPRLLELLITIFNIFTAAQGLATSSLAAGAPRASRNRNKAPSMILTDFTGIVSV